MIFNIFYMFSLMSVLSVVQNPVSVEIMAGTAGKNPSMGAWQ
jgi:hypothetical protein